MFFLLFFFLFRINLLSFWYKSCFYTYTKKKKNNIKKNIVDIKVNQNVMMLVLWRRQRKMYVCLSVCVPKLIYKDISNTKPTSSTTGFAKSSKNGIKSNNSLSCRSLNQLLIGIE